MKLWCCIVISLAVICAGALQPARNLNSEVDVQAVPKHSNAIPLDEFMGLPNVNWLTSITTPDGRDLIGWVEYFRGVVNVFIAEGPKFVPTQCSFNSKDEGLDVNSLTFTADGKRIYYNGNSIHSSDLTLPTVAPSDASNPTFRTFPLRPKIVSITTDCNPQNEVVVATDVSLGAVHPNGAIVYASGRQAVQSVIHANNSVTTTVLFEVQSDQGYLSDFTWSPDGTALAFTNYRGDHSFVGIFTSSTSPLQWLNPSFDVDSSPAWSPDSRKVAYYRFYDVVDSHDRLLVSQFQVFVTDMATGQSTQVFEDSHVGFPVTYGFGVRPLVWFDNNNVLFPCEQSKWLHVCSAAATGGKVTELVTGACEVQDFIPSAKGVYVSHNCENLDALAINLLRIDSNQNITVVSSNINSAKGMSDGGFGMAPLSNGLAYISTGFNTSTQIIFWTAKSGEHRTITDVHQTIASDIFVKPTPVEFTSLDKKWTIHAQLFMPKTNQSKYPAVIFTHGGPMRQMYNGFHYSVDYAQLYSLNQYFAYNGFVVLSINYRMGVGYGKEFRDCTGCGRWGGAEYQDVLGGNKWLAAQSFVDPQKIGIHGLSYGGLNCLQALSRNSDVFAAGAANAPVFNWLSTSRFDGDILYDYNPQMPGLAIKVGPEPNLATPEWTTKVNENIQLSWTSSPSGFIDSFRSPVLVIHGDSDRNVDVQESIGLIRALRTRGGVEVKSMMFPNERHGLALYSNDLKAAQATFDFLSSHLK